MWRESAGEMDGGQINVSLVDVLVVCVFWDENEKRGDEQAERKCEEQLKIHGLFCTGASLSECDSDQCKGRAATGTIEWCVSIAEVNPFVILTHLSP